MSVLYILIAFSLLVALGFLAAFLWAVRSGQYDDTHTPSMRILFEGLGKTSQTGQTSKPSKQSNIPNTRAVEFGHITPENSDSP